MKIDVTQTIKNWDGSPFQVPIRACPMCGRPQEMDPPLTLRSMCLKSIEATLNEDRGVAAETKFILYDLGMKIQKNDIVALTAKDVTMLQERINIFYLSALVVPQAHRMLEAG